MSNHSDYTPSSRRCTGLHCLLIHACLPVATHRPLVPVPAFPTNNSPPSNDRDLTCSRNGSFKGTVSIHAASPSPGRPLLTVLCSQATLDSIRQSHSAPRNIQWLEVPRYKRHPSRLQIQSSPTIKSTKQQPQPQPQPQQEHKQPYLQSHHPP
jgi:hypothetical protein